MSTRHLPEFCINCNLWYNRHVWKVCCPGCLHPRVWRHVLWLNKSAYVVRNMERDNAGYIHKAVVVNGLWQLVFDSSVWIARGKSGRITIAKWDVTSYQEIAVPSTFRTNEMDLVTGRLVESYEPILKWADKQKG